jgi:hypothetical protein
MLSFPEASQVDVFVLTMESTLFHDNKLYPFGLDGLPQRGTFNTQWPV